MIFHRSFFFLLMSICCIFCACNKENYIVDIKEEINPQGWTFADAVNFEFDIQDSSMLYTMLLDIDHLTNYPYQNIYFYISTHFPSGEKVSQQLSSDLAHKSGAWYGKCSNNQCKASINLQETARFTELGKYKISISQYTRDSSLIGVKQLNFKLAEFKKKSKE